MSTITITRSYDVRQTLPRVMKLNRATTIEVGERIDYTQSYVSKLMHGKTALKFESIESLLEALPDQNEYLAMDIAYQMTGITPPVANGPGIKDEVGNYAHRSIRELKEAIVALMDSDDEFETPAELVKNRQDPEKAIDELLDVVFVAQNATVRMCHEYDYSLQERMARRKKVWKMNMLVR